MEDYPPIIHINGMPYAPACRFTVMPVQVEHLPEFVPEPVEHQRQAVVYIDGVRFTSDVPMDKTSELHMHRTVKNLVNALDPRIRDIEEIKKADKIKTDWSYRLIGGNSLDGNLHIWASPSFEMADRLGEVVCKSHGESVQIVKVIATRRLKPEITELHGKDE